MLQPSKVQGEARSCNKRHFGALRAQLCALRAQGQLENLTNCPLLIATHSNFYASTLKSARGSQKLQKKGILARFVRDCVRCARRVSLKIWPTVHYFLLHIVTFMLQPLKMQGEARNCENGHFCALHARLRVLRARDLDAGHCSTGVLTRRTFGPSFVALRQFVLPLLPRTISERRWPHRSLPSTNPPQKGNLLASLGG